MVRKQEHWKKPRKVRWSWSESSPTAKTMLQESSLWHRQSSLQNCNQLPECWLQHKGSMSCSCPRAQSHACSVSPGTHFLHCGITHPWPSRQQVRNSLPLFPILAMFPLFSPFIPKLDGTEQTSRGWAAKVTVEKTGWALGERGKGCTDGGPWEKYQTGQNPWTWQCRQPLREQD